MRCGIVVVLLWGLGSFLARAQSCSEDEPCLQESQWQLGLAIGAGVKTNPLTDGDNIPLVLLPDIAWYGESAYFDNGELGYQWHQSVHWALASYVKFDTERAYFSFWHPANVLLTVNRSDLLMGPEQVEVTGPQRLSVDQVSRRDWAVLGGLRAYYLLQPGREWYVALEKDVSGVHSGEKLELSYRHEWMLTDIKVSTQLIMSWKSAALLNYYYGIDKHDRVDPSFFYQARAGWQPAISVSVQKPLNESWIWLSSVSLQHLNAGMTNSPLVEKNNVYRVFSGFAYQF